MEEQISEGTLSEIFCQIKGTRGTHRAFIQYEDFKEAVLRFRPPCMINDMDTRKSSSENMTQFGYLVEDHFRNICESQHNATQSIDTSLEFAQP